MNRKDLICLKKWFTDYVAGYYTDDPDYNRAVKLKEEHSIRVCRDIIMLGRSLRLSEQEMILAETMALFHDIGRFKQHAVYGTFNDMISENHAKLGLRQIAAHRILSVCTKYEKRLITRSIAFHNAAVLPENEDEKTLFYMRLLRDADKLDIWKVVTDYYAEREKQQNSILELGLPDDPVCSQNVIKALYENRIVRFCDLKTLNDFKLLQISWVFDLNFAPSFQAVQSREYLERIEITLPRSKEIAEAVKHAYNYVNSFSGTRTN